MKLFYDTNISTILLLWPLEFSYSELDYFGMVDAFVHDKNKPTYFGYFVYILVDSRKKGRIDFPIFENKFLSETYNYGESLTVYKYRFPKKFEKDFELIVDSKYSSLS